MRTCLFNPPPRRGFSLLELITATALTATLAASSMVLLRTTHSAWLLHRRDQTVRQSAVSALQHLTRHVRQAEAIVAISPPGDTSGRVGVRDVDGALREWAHDGATNQILFGPAPATDLLAEGITGMTVVGLGANGWQPTTEPAAVRSVRCTLSFQLDRPAGPVAEQVSCQAWIRSW